jgi:hypothetical protein
MEIHSFIGAVDVGLGNLLHLRRPEETLLLNAKGASGILGLDENLRIAFADQETQEFPAGIQKARAIKESGRRPRRAGSTEQRMLLIFAYVVPSDQ